MTSVLVPASTVALLTRTLEALQGDEPAPTKVLPRWLPNGDPITEVKDLAAVLCVDETTAAFVVLGAFNPPPDLLAEAKRRVKTPAGARWYGQPIGSEIRPDGPSTMSRIMAAIMAGSVAMTFLGAAADIGHVEFEGHKNEFTMSASAFHDKESSLTALKRFTQTHQEQFDNPAAHLAIWHDDENDEYVVDIARMEATDGRQGAHIQAAKAAQRDDRSGDRHVVGGGVGGDGARAKAPITHNPRYRIVRYRA